MFEGIRTLVDDPTKPAPPTDLADTLRNVRELTKIGEHEMHEAVLACTRARRQMLRQSSASKPVLH
jgi:hypothetical protein